MVISFANILFRTCFCSISQGDFEVLKSRSKEASYCGELKTWPIFIGCGLKSLCIYEWKNKQFLLCWNVKLYWEQKMLRSPLENIIWLANRKANQCEKWVRTYCAQRWRGSRSCGKSADTLILMRAWNACDASSSDNSNRNFSCTFGRNEMDKYWGKRGKHLPIIRWIPLKYSSPLPQEPLTSPRGSQETWDLKWDLLIFLK